MTVEPSRDEAACVHFTPLRRFETPIDAKVGKESDVHYAQVRVEACMLIGPKWSQFLWRPALRPFNVDTLSFFHRTHAARLHGFQVIMINMVATSSSLSSSCCPPALLLGALMTSNIRPRLPTSRALMVNWWP